MNEWTSARLVRLQEPYHFQRKRQRYNNAPRPAQPNTNQPNQKLAYSNRTTEYWDLAFKQYLDRGKSAASLTNLALGRK